MTLIQYAGFLAVTVIAIVFVLRGCFFLFVCKSDPVKAIVPRWPKTRKENEAQLVGES